MLVQELMIGRVREICQQDARLVAAMMYGSFTRGEGDEFSDIEFVLFFADHTLAGVDQRAWVSQIAPVELFFVNEYGNRVAIFDNLVRGEFHFNPASHMAEVATWHETDDSPAIEPALMLDRSGELSAYMQALIGLPQRDAAARVQFLADSFINWALFGINVLERGELARTLDILNHMQGYLLWMARLVERQTAHWPTPSRAVEGELSTAAYQRFVACTARLDQRDLHRAYATAWGWGKEMIAALFARHNLSLPATLLAKLDERLLRDGG